VPSFLVPEELRSGALKALNVGYQPESADLKIAYPRDRISSAKLLALTRHLRLAFGSPYTALGSPSLLAVGNRTEAPGCLLEQVVNAALGQAFHDAEAVLLSHLGNVTLEELSIAFHKRLARRRNPHDLKSAHPS
jgi:hypothetical protein